ncbi:MAG: DUF559 domain-containing protein [Ignavibacteria bacterium]|nr:DUF559 domain-containing protein [Ignavibacteria bacterium]
MNRLVQTARRLRKKATNAEKRLWQLLRNRRLNGKKIRTQVPIDDFLVDFCCHERKPIIEIDGPAHESADQQKKDANTDMILNNLGFRVLRIKESDVFDKQEMVLNEFSNCLCEQRN